MKHPKIHSRPTSKLLYKLLVFVFAIGNFCNCFSQTITTVAGTGLSTSTGDGGPASLATLFPGSIAIDKFGNYYIGDGYHSFIRKVGINDTISTIAGNGTMGFSGDGGAATDAQIGVIDAMICDTLGNLFFCDISNNRIRKVSIDGIISTIVGDSSYAYNGDGLPATSTSIYNPAGIAFDSHGNLYFSDAGHSRVRKMSVSGIVTTIAGNGSLSFGGDGGQATAAQIYHPRGIAIDAHDNIYFSDYNNRRIRKISSSGIITTVVGNGIGGYSGYGGAATAATFDGVIGVKIDKYNNIYFSDYGNMTVNVVYSNGNIATLAGNGTCGFAVDSGLASASILCDPWYIALDSCGNIYVPDGGNWRVRKITFDHCNYLSTPTVKNISQTPAYYPNPFSSELTIENKTPIESLVVFNLLGQKIFEDNNLPQQKAIDTRNWPNGMYLLQINHGTIQKVLKGE